MALSTLGNRPTLEDLQAMIGPPQSSSPTPGWERALVNLGQSLGGHIRETPFMQVADSGDWQGAGETMANILMRDVLGRDPETGEQGMPGVGLGGMVKPLTGAPSYIKNWKWKSPTQVQEELGLPENLPTHIKPFGEYMQEKASKELTARDLIKALTISRSSIQRGAIGAEKVPDKLRWAAGEDGKIRPEDAFSAWLLSPEGRRYLNAAEVGKVDPGAIESAVKVIKPFGKDNDMRQAMEWAAQELPGREAAQGAIVKRAMAGEDVVNDWLQEIADYRGIGPSKAGFYGSLLGYGGLPTLDARQLALHTTNPKLLGKYGKRGGGEGGTQAVMRLAKRQNDMGLGLPQGMEPFRQHLTHHAVWDQSAGEKNTHAAIIEAMKAAGVGGLSLLPAAGAYLSQDQGTI